jgi:hypothetical protein
VLSGRAGCYASTGPERTLVEGFCRPSLAGGLEKLVRSASGFSTLDLDLLEKVLVQCLRSSVPDFGNLYEYFMLPF